jgi:thioredoxin reductase (NADPH)
MTYDAIIVGAGPAGLSAAIYLGRYLRPTLVLDRGKVDSPWLLPTAHNFFGFPAGIMREQLLAWGRDHAGQYESVEIREAVVTGIEQAGECFRARTSDGEEFDSRGIILATGEFHELPPIPNILSYAGRSVFHCPECDGYKARGRRTAVMGTGRATAGFSLRLKAWTPEIVLCTLGDPPDLDPEAREKLEKAGISVVEDRVLDIEGDPRQGAISGLALESGGKVEAQLAFTNYRARVYSNLARSLGADVIEEGYVKVDKHQHTNVRGLYAAGDVCAPNHKQLSIAVANGATAAINLHYALLPPELCLEEPAVRTYHEEGWLPPQPDQLR